MPQVPQTPMPWGDSPVFDPEPMREVAAFTETEARRTMAIYGAWDPWTGGAITVDEANDSVRIVVPEQNHGAELAHLPEAQRDEAYARLLRWVNGPRLVGGGSGKPRAWEHREGHARIVAEVVAHERRARARSRIEAVARSRIEAAARRR